MNTDALFVVDPQNGFSKLCPKELPVEGALDIIAPINELLELPFARKDMSLDWHPADHDSFKIYPPHCVMDTFGASPLSGLNTHKIHVIWRKGYDKTGMAYSAVDQHPYLPHMFIHQGIKRIFFCGICTNICVIDTALGMILNCPMYKDVGRPFYEVYIVEDASAGIDIPALDIDQKAAKAKGIANGIKYITVAEVKKMVKE
jgi:nicotinamidase/pyrazinamidase